MRRVLLSASLGMVAGVVFHVAAGHARLDSWKTHEVERVAMWEPGGASFVPVPSAPAGARFVEAEDGGVCMQGPDADRVCWTGSRFERLTRPLVAPPDLPAGSLVVPLGRGAFLANALEGPDGWFVAADAASAPVPPLLEDGHVASAARLPDGRIAVGAGPNGARLQLEKPDRTGFVGCFRVPFDADVLVATGDRLMLFDETPSVAVLVDGETCAPEGTPETGGRVTAAIADADGRVFVHLFRLEPLGWPGWASQGLWGVVCDVGLTTTLLWRRKVARRAFLVGAVLALALTPPAWNWLWPPVASFG